MTTEKKHKKDKEVLLELEYQIKEVKHQLTEQLKCLDGRLENHFAMTAELAEFYQKRAEAEMEYAKNLDKIVRQILTKHKAERQKRESWQNYSTFKLWQTLLEVTSKQSKCHAIFSESLTNIVATKFAQMRDDMNYIYRKCYEMATSLHAELHKSMTELHSFLKTYQQYHGESKLLQSKLLRAETQKSKVEQDHKKGTLSKKLINFDKKTEKHRLKVQEGNLKALKARNEYLLSIDSTNAALRKYFIDDLPDLINAMDYGYHISLGQVTVNAVDLEAMVNKLNNDYLAIIANKAKDLNQISDRQVFLQLHHQIFSLPKRYDFLSHKGDAASEVQAPTQLRDEMVSRVQTIMERLHALKLENDELWKTLETTDNSMVAKLTSPDVDVSSIFTSDKPVFKSNAADLEKMAKEKTETQNFYFNKFKNYELNSNLAARLQAKCVTLEKVLAISKTGLNSHMGLATKRSVTLSNRQLKRRTLGKFALESQPKLFGGSIREYVNATGQEIPLVIRCCTKIINLYGMHHQGVFRIPGLQHEINEYKSMFERGEEPILVKVETRDINSVAGVLKLYFRELSEPLFPLQLFDELVACSKYNVEDPEELKKCIERLQELLLPLPRTILIVIRYLFAFLNHLSEYSDENMMDAHNLSVCFGPTLIPVPPDHDPVNHQNQINELVRILIVYQEKIFPNDGGAMYEKFIVDEENDLEESVDNLLEGAGGENSEDDVECCLEAVALHDFQGRTDQEVTLKKGETLKLFKRVSSDWWEGATNEHTGLIPHKFIAVNNRRRIAGSVDGEDKLFVSTESLPSRSASVTTTMHSNPTNPSDSNFDRSVSQPNICESPPNLKKDKEVKTTKHNRNDSTLSSTSTVTFSESSFSNLSDENRLSLEGSVSSRKDSYNKDDYKDSRKSSSKDSSSTSRSCDCRKSSTIERKGESFSPLIPVLEIIEPLEIVLEVKDTPSCCSAIITPTDSVEASTVISTTNSIVNATQSSQSSSSTPPSNSSTGSSGSGCSGDPCSNTSAVASSSGRPPLAPNRRKSGDILSMESKVESSGRRSPSQATNLVTLSTLPKESPEKSPIRISNPSAQSYFSFSLVPLLSKPPQSSPTKSGSSSPSNLSEGTEATTEPPLTKTDSLSPPWCTTTNTTVAFTETSFNDILITESEQVTDESTTVTETSVGVGVPPSTITTRTMAAPLQISEVAINIADSSSPVPILESKIQDFVPCDDAHPPPPDELLADLPKFPGVLSVRDSLLPEGSSPGDDSLPAPSEELLSDECKKLKTSPEELEPSPIDLPSLSTPSFLLYMQNRQKQGVFSLPQGPFQDRLPSQQQLNSQFATTSEAIASASFKDLKTTAKSFYTPSSEAKQSRDLTSTKSLDISSDQVDSNLKNLSATKNASSPQVPGSFGSSSTIPKASSLARPQEVGVHTSPRMSALSFNLPTLSIYTTLAPTAVTSTSSSLASFTQYSTPQGISSSATTTATPLPQSLSLPYRSLASSSPKPLFTSLPASIPLKSQDNQPASPTVSSSSSQATVSSSTVLAASTDKSRIRPPPTMKKPGGKF